MKIYFIILIPFIVVIAEANAQELKILETVHLNNGSRISGFITEQIPGGNYTIETDEGNLFVFPESDVDKITREVINIDPYMGLDYNPRHGEFGITAGTPGGFNVIIGYNSKKYHSHFTIGNGVQLCLAYILGQSRDYRHYLGFSTSTSINESIDYFFIGPVYSLNVHSLMVEFGVGYGNFNSVGKLAKFNTEWGAVPHLQIGFNPRFTRIRQKNF